MNASHVAFLTSRVISIYFAYQVLSVIIALAATGGTAETIVLLFSAVNMVVNAAIAIAFWVLAGPISQKLLPGTDAPELTAVTAADVQAAAITLAGFMFLIKAVPQISQLVLIFTQKFIVPDMPFRFSPTELWSSSIEAVLYIGIGLVLICWSKCVAKCINKKCEGKQ